MGLGLSDGTGHYSGKSSAGSLVGGVNWIDNGDGTYTMDLDEGVNGAYHASPLDRYLMGLIGGEQLPPTFLQNNNRSSLADGETIYPTDIAATITANHLIAANGFRTPGPAEAQRHFNLAFVAESHERPLTATEMTYYEIMAAHYTKVLPPEKPDPYVSFGWQPVTRFFGEGVTWSSEVQHDARALALFSGTMAENGGAAALTGTVTRPGNDLSAPLTVWLSSSDASELAVPRSVEIAAGQASATFSIDAVDDDLADGTQTVSVTALAYPFVATNDTVQVTDDEPLPVRQLRGLAWADLDGDGVRGRWEPPLTNWPVFLDVNQNGALDYGETSTTTDGSGEYTFDNPPPGTHTIAQIKPTGWLQRWPTLPPVPAAVATSIHDEPHNGTGDSFNANPQLMQHSLTAEDRVVMEYDLGFLASRTVAAANLSFTMEPVNPVEGSSRGGVIGSYTGNGTADLADFSATTLPFVYFGFSTSMQISFNVNVMYGLQQVLSSGGRYFGLRFDASSENTPAMNVSNVVLTLILADGSPYTVTLGENEHRSGLDFGSQDTTAPTVTLASPAMTDISTPVVTVVATDNGSLPDGTIAAIDGDFNRDGDFTDPGEAGFAYGVLTGGTATFALNGALPDGTYNLRATVRDAFRNSASSTPRSIVVEAAPPRVLSILRNGAALTNASSLAFTVTFSDAVIGVGIDDFVTTTTGMIAGAAVTSVSGSGKVYIVTVDTGIGDGTLRLDLVDDNTIVGDAGKLLGGTQPGDGNYTLGHTCTIDKTVPQVVSIVRYSYDPVESNYSTLHYVVTLSEATSGWDKTDFRVVTTGNLTATIGTVVRWTSNTVLMVYVNTGTGDGTLTIDVVDDDTIRDPAGNALGGAGAGNGDFIGQSPPFTVLKDRPVVTSIVLADASPTAATSVAFLVNFSKDVFLVDVGDFAVTTSGLTGASVSRIDYVGSGNWTTYKITVSTGTGSGSLRLDLIDNDSIVDRANNRLGGSGAGNGNFTSGPSYTMDRTAPAVIAISMLDTSPTYAASVRYQVSLSEPVSGVDVGDFALSVSGLAGSSITGVTGSGSTYTVAVNTGTGVGTLRIDLVDDDSIRDVVMLPLGGPEAGNGNATGPIYVVDRTGEVRVVGRRIFYNNSSFDAGGNDGAAVAPNPAELAAAGKDPNLGKEALLPGGTATFKNYISYSRGINGIFLDVAELRSANLAPSDFTFKVGNDSNPVGWATAASPSIAVGVGMGAGGSDRITLVWPDNAIPNGNWLQVTLKTETSGLAAPDVFYFGSAMGETGNNAWSPAPDGKVSSLDAALTRLNNSSFATVGIENAYDFNRDAVVNSFDAALCRLGNNLLNPLQLIQTPATAPMATFASAPSTTRKATLGANPTGSHVALDYELIDVLVWDQLRAKKRTGSADPSLGAVPGFLQNWKSLDAGAAIAGDSPRIPAEMNPEFPP